MLPPEEKARLQREREAFREFLKGTRGGPFILARREAYCVCEVLSPSIWARLRWPLRAMLTGIAGLIPLSPFKILLYRLLGAKIGQRVYIAPGVVIDPLYPELIELGDDCFLGMGCRLFTHEYTTTHLRIGRLRVGPGSVIGGYSTVRPGVSIGEKVTVGFNSYVNRDIPNGEMVGGVPARPLKSRPES